MREVLLVAALIWGLVCPAAAVCPTGEAAQSVNCAPRGAGWICLAPELAALCPAELEQCRRDCDLRLEAQSAEAETVLRRELGAKDIELEHMRHRYGVVLEVLADSEEAKADALDEASSRWTTWELVGWVAGGIALGAGAGVLAVVLAR